MLEAALGEDPLLLGRARVLGDLVPLGDPTQRLDLDHVARLDLREERRVREVHRFGALEQGLDAQFGRLITHAGSPQRRGAAQQTTRQHEGGGTIKTNLIGIDPDPAKITLGMDVEVTYGIAPRKDGEGNEYMTYVIKPAA